MNLRRTRAVARKETLHILRDPRSLLLALGIPLLMIIMFGYALTLDVDRVPLVVWDQSRTPQSREFISHFTGSRYFSLLSEVTDYPSLELAVDRRDAYLGMVIPGDFALRLSGGKPCRVQVLVDGADSNTAALVLGYVQAVGLGYDQQLLIDSVRRRLGQVPVSPLDLRMRVWFNPDLQSKNFIIPGLIAVILGLIAALLTSLTIAREWERGTMEQLISTPVRPAELILGKLAPYFVIGMIDVLAAVLMAVLWFDVPLRGSIPLLFGMAALFIVGTLAQGILISTLARQQLLASQIAMVSTFLPAFLLSGFMFAIPNMPPPVQGVTYLVPARYFVSLVKGIYLRGVGLGLLWPDALFLLAFSVVVTGLAIHKFRKRLD
jgi:ABC-2 type transport system permease protein